MCITRYTEISIYVLLCGAIRLMEISVYLAISFIWGSGLRFLFVFKILYSCAIWQRKYAMLNVKRLGLLSYVYPEFAARRSTRCFFFFLKKIVVIKIQYIYIFAGHDVLPYKIID